MTTYTIKQLEWWYKKRDHEWEATADGGVKYSVCAGHKDRMYKWYFKDGFVDETNTMKEAKAACQVHYERMVMKHLVKSTGTEANT